MKIEIGRKFIRTNPDAEIYDIFVEIGKIQNHNIKSSKTLTKKSTKKYLIEKISKRLLEIKFEENHSIKSSCLKFIVKKYWHLYKPWSKLILAAKNKET